jgi:hypothetical protein
VVLIYLLLLVAVKYKSEQMEASEKPWDRKESGHHEGRPFLKENAVDELTNRLRERR